MDVMEQLREKVRANPRKVVLPEAGEERILLAARRARDMGIAYPVLVGEPGAITELAESLGVSLEGLTLADHTDEKRIEALVTRFTAQHTDFTASAIRRKIRKPLYFGAMMVTCGEADFMVAGLSHTTGEVILASQMIIGLEADISTVSSMGIMSVPGYQGEEGNLLAIADCAVCPAPDPTELADIAISTADTVVRLLGWEPRIALLSFSTRGSAAHDRVDQVIEALEQVKRRRPDLLIDGELQLDSAINPRVAARKIKDQSPVAGRANILIFPDLNSGNIGVKLVQQFAGGTAYGPLLQGFARPVSDLSRGAPVEEIVGAITMAGALVHD
ncbi:MAG: phosphate acyltransferase [Pseudomonadota bacterium]